MHPLHKLIGEIIRATEIPDCQPILGKDCGGNHNIQLFCSENAELATRFCSIDAAVLKNGEVKAVFEIEESDIRPVALCGKIFVSAHSSHFVHRGKRYPIASCCSFVQVIDTKKLPSRSSKLAQCWNLAELIRITLSTDRRKMGYDIFHGDIAEFERPEAQQELQAHLRAATSLPDEITSTVQDLREESNLRLARPPPEARGRTNQNITCMAMRSRPRTCQFPRPVVPPKSKTQSSEIPDPERSDIGHNSEFHW